MTLSQKARLAGIKVSIVWRGRTASAGDDLLNIPCLVEARDPASYEAQFSKETRRESIISIVKTSLSRIPKIGEIWTLEDSTKHRIIIFQNDSADVFYKFTCEAS